VSPEPITTPLLYDVPANDVGLNVRAEVRLRSAQCWGGALHRAGRVAATRSCVRKSFGGQGDITRSRGSAACVGTSRVR